MRVAWLVMVSFGAAACGEPARPLLDRTARHVARLRPLAELCAIPEEQARDVVCPPGTERDGYTMDGIRDVFCVAGVRKTGPSASWPVPWRLSDESMAYVRGDWTTAGQLENGDRVGAWISFRDGVARAIDLHGSGNPIPIASFACPATSAP